MAFVYIIELRDKTHYCGITNNVVKRIQQHQQGKSKSTKHKLPLVIKYITTKINMSAARKLEVQIKKQGVSRWWTKNKFRSDNEQGK